MRDLPGANRADARSDPRLLGERPAAYAARAVQGTEGLRLLQREPRRGRQPPDHPGRVLEARGVHRAAVLAVALLAAAAGAGLLGDEHLGVLAARAVRSEEHTSELQSLMRSSYSVFCLKKKKYME